jgi:hypothetical protein
LFFFCFFLFRSSDFFDALIEEGPSWKVFSAVKDGKKYAIRMMRYGTKDEIELADNGEQTFKLLKGSYPYLMSLEDSFKYVFFFYFYIFFFLLTFVKVLL